MIAYDDLVAALASWRARQGLPVAAGAPSAPGPATASLPPTRPPARSAPPHAPPRAASPPVAAAVDDFDGDALIEESSYDSNGDDYVVQLGRGVQIDAPGESTAVGADVVTEGLLVPKRKRDW
jgi:hypothetical protein